MMVFAKFDKVWINVEEVVAVAKGQMAGYVDIYVGGGSRGDAFSVKAASEDEVMERLIEAYSSDKDSVVDYLADIADALNEISDNAEPTGDR